MTRIVIWLLLILGCTEAFAANVAGRVVEGDQPLPGMRVAAYNGLDFSGTPLAVSPPSDADGRYQLELSPGLYSLFARDETGSRFAFCGRNPVAVAAEPVWAGLQAVPVVAATSQPYDDPDSAAITGTVTLGGKPLAGAYVYLYLDAAEDLKGQGYRMSAPTGNDGRFSFDGLPESDYFLVARQRDSGARVGPVREGDALAIYPGNPVHARTGQQLTVSMEAVRKVQDGKESETISRATGMAIRGQILDRQRRPVAGLHVFAYTDRVIGHKRPEALSAPTGPDGRFIVHLRQPGTFYIGARQEYGDSPAPGELFGMYDASADHGLEVAPGQSHDDILILVEPVTLD